MIWVAILTFFGLLIAALIVLVCVLLFRVESLAKAKMICRMVGVIDAHHN